MVQQSGDSSFQLVDMMQNDSSPLIGFGVESRLHGRLRGSELYTMKTTKEKGSSWRFLNRLAHPILSKKYS